jgi:hypothetical protein
MNLLYASSLTKSQKFVFFQLTNCGHILNETSLSYLLPALTGVEFLTMHGLYRLNQESSLSTCLSNAKDSLRSLNLSYAYNCVSRDNLSIIA